MLCGVTLVNMGLPCWVTMVAWSQSRLTTAWWKDSLACRSSQCSSVTPPCNQSQLSIEASGPITAQYWGQWTNHSSVLRPVDQSQLSIHLEDAPEEPWYQGPAHR